MKYTDTSTVGRSSLVPYVEGESPKDRHRRRFDAANSMISHLQELILGSQEARGWNLTITNNGHHWKLKRGKKSVEWWPSSAKVVVNHRWQNGTHVHDVQQLFRLLLKQNKRKNGRQKSRIRIQENEK